jgi:hypothetical protein
MSSKLGLAVRPHKHVRFAEASVTLAGKLRALLDEPRTVDQLRELLRRECWPGPKDIVSVGLAASLLFAIGVIAMDEDGRLRRTR